MPLIVSVREDEAIQYTPAQAKYYKLKPHYDSQLTDASEPAYREISFESEESVILCAETIHHCHTVIIKDRTHNNYFMLHVSPQSLRKPYDSKKSSFTLDLGHFGIFGSEEALFTHLRKPAYIDLDPHYYKDIELGTHENSQLDVIIVVNSQHWNESIVETNILQILKERIPGTINNTNIIINQALEHAYYYNVEFNPQTEELTVRSRNGWYSEPYANAFTNNQHSFVAQQLPQERQLELRTSLLELLSKQNAVNDFLFNMLASDITIDQLVLDPPTKMVLFRKRNNETLHVLITEIEKVLKQTITPVLDLESPLLYKTYKRLAILYATLGNYECAAVYFARVSDYAENMRRAEYDADKQIYSIFSGAAFESVGNLQQAYTYYNFTYYEKPVEEEHSIDEIDAKIRMARVAAQIKGLELEALEYAVGAKHALQLLIDEVQKDDSPDKEELMLMLDRRLSACQIQIDNLESYLIDNHEKNRLLELEYEARFGYVAEL
ncbi:hypothetical protein [Legionella rowbothamii]|uniref:hypothetical protein n=1 Tax=Legionella rowbothamii TaxID=96229 RepID=UPI001054C567|nr:hypothetical protein [Legionella rowbothamii]